MDAAMKTIFAPNKNIRITKWKVKRGHKVSQGSILCIYETDESKGLKIKSSFVGTVHEIMGQEGDRKPPGSVLVTIEPCKHPTVMKDMCAECGADLREEAGLAGERKEPVTATVAMVHSIPELIISEEQAKEIGKEDEMRLLKTKKLVLLVDLDQTLIHTTNDRIPANLKGVFHYQLRHGYGVMWYHTRIRPWTQHFLETISKMYELHICTFGARMYAHTIARHLDPEEKYFSHRILSRDECFNPNSKTANLKALFPCGDKMVAIIDDREDVWNFAPNLIHVRPYRFFQGTADINAPPGLTKTEHDLEPVHHRVRRVSRSNSVDKEVKINDQETKGDKSIPDKTGIEERSKETNNKDKMDNEEKIVSEVEERKNKDKTEDEEKEDETGIHLKEKPDINKTESSRKKTECSHSDNENNNRNITITVQSETVKDEAGEHVDQSESKINKDIQQSEKCDKGEEDSTLHVEDDETVLKPVDKNIAQSEKGGDLELEKNVEETTNIMETDDNCTNNKKEKQEVESSSKETNDTLSDKEKAEENADNTTEDDVEIEWEDEDDYLLYLEEILTRIHKTFFDFYDQLKSKKEKDEIPDLKDIISYIKRKVLQGVNIVFSGVFPNNIQPEKSRAYIVAKSLGANVQTNIIPKSDVEKGQSTTHLVAAKLGTNKVRMAQKVKGIKIVNPNWLWNCAERYERVDERLFPLDKESSKMGTCDSPDITQDNNRKRKSDPNDMGETSGKRPKQNEEEIVINTPSEIQNKASTSALEANEETIDDESAADAQKVSDERADDGENVEMADDLENVRFISTYNPLLAFSDDDLACMDREVEDIMDEDQDDNSSEDEDERNCRMRSFVLSSGDTASSSEDSLSGDLPKGWKKKENKSGSSESPCSSDHDKNHDVESENDLEKFENTVEAFAPDTESDNESVGSMDDEMAAAIEKEFLEL